MSTTNSQYDQPPLHNNEPLLWTILDNFFDALRLPLLLLAIIINIILILNTSFYLLYFLGTILKALAILLSGCENITGCTYSFTAWSRSDTGGGRQRPWSKHKTTSSHRKRRELSLDFNYYIQLDPCLLTQLIIIVTRLLDYVGWGMLCWFHADIISTMLIPSWYHIHDVAAFSCHW